MTLEFFGRPKRSISVVVDHEDDYDNLLSEEARRNFDVIRSMLVVDDFNDGGNDATLTEARDSSATSEAPAIRLKRRKLDEVASATVQMIQDEIAYWQRSIAELETMIIGKIGDATEPINDLNLGDGYENEHGERLRNIGGLPMHSVQDGELSSRSNSSIKGSQGLKELLR
jgi:hypothetical protein